MSQAALSPSLLSVARDRAGEFVSLCACASTNPAPEQIALIADWGRCGIEWSQFRELAEHHSVLPLVAKNLSRYARGLPSEFQQSLQSIYESNLRRSLWFAAELTRILGHFELGKVPVVPYKGPVLAQSAYGDLGLRSFFDLDLLISPADFTLAKQVLTKMGYQPSEEISPSIERLWLRTGYERSFDGVAGKNLVELQWNLLPHFYAVDLRPAEFQVEDLLARAGRIKLGEWDGAAEIPCLSPEDSLLTLCLHAAKHLWTRLIWVADIAESARVRSIDFEMVAKRARAMGIARIVGVSFDLARQLLGTTTPPAIDQLLRRDPEVQILGREFRERLSATATYNFESTEYFRRVYRLRERGSDQRRYLWRLLWTPGPGDVAVMKLPEFAFPLYRAVRIGRLLPKLL